MRLGKSGIFPLQLINGYMIWHQIIQADKLTSNINTFSSQADKLLVLQVPACLEGGRKGEEGVHFGFQET